MATPATDHLPLPCPPLPAHAGEYALFLDFDGTLCALAPHPDEVCFDAEVGDLLQRLSSILGGALCVISGRSLPSLARQLSPTLGIACIGGHGAEDPLAPAGDTHAAARLAEVLEAVREQVQEVAGAWIERKPHGFSLHLPEGPVGRNLAERLEALVLREPHLRVQRGHRIIEAVPALHSKGTALQSRMRLPTFRGRLPVMLGDDLTDENGFASAAALGGFGVVVGSRRPTAAGFALPDPGSVKRWLLQVERACAQGRGGRFQR